MKNKSVELSDKAKQAKKEYMKVWRAKNKEKVRENNRKYLKKWREKNPGRVKEYNRRYWEKKAQETDVTDNAVSVTDGVTDMEDVTDNVTDVENVTDNGICVICGVELTGRKGAVTCSPACRQKLYRQRAK